MFNASLAVAVTQEFAQRHINGCDQCSKLELDVSEVALRCIALMVEAENGNEDLRRDLEKKLSFYNDIEGGILSLSEEERGPLLRKKEELDRKIQELQQVQGLIGSKDLEKCEAIASHMIDPFADFEVCSEVDPHEPIFGRQQSFAF